MLSSKKSQNILRFEEKNRKRFLKCKGSDPKHCPYPSQKICNNCYNCRWFRNTNSLYI